MRNRPQITQVPKKDKEDMDQCTDDDHALIIWHENYPFGMSIVGFSFYYNLH